MFIADFETSYISKFDYLYILGNNEGVLPSQKLDNGLITDDELKNILGVKKMLEKAQELKLQFEEKVKLSATPADLEQLRIELYLLNVYLYVHYH